MSDTRAAVNPAERCLLCDGTGAYHGATCGACEGVGSPYRVHLNVGGPFAWVAACDADDTTYARYTRIAEEVTCRFCREGRSVWERAR